MDDIARKEVLDYLGENKLMALGTYYKEPWVASVYYLFDDNFNFYFISDPATKHCKNIAKNPKVSIVVVDTKQNPKGKKIGFQARGVAKRVSNVNEIKDLVVSWNKRGFVPMTLKLITKAWKSRFYKIKLTHVQMFDENQPEELEIREWKL